MTAPIPIVSNVTLGTAGGSTAITANLTADPAQWLPTYVTLSTSYVQASPGGFPVGTPGMLDGNPNSSRGSYTEGQRAQFFAVEAAALVAASAGAYS
jgi:hypothetical protein